MHLEVIFVVKASGWSADGHFNLTHVQCSPKIFWFSHSKIWYSGLLIICWSTQSPLFLRCFQIWLMFLPSCPLLMVRHQATNYTPQWVSGSRGNFLSNSDELPGNFLRKLPDPITKAMHPGVEQEMRTALLLRLEGDNKGQRTSQFQQTPRSSTQEKNICTECVESNDSDL